MESGKHSQNIDPTHKLTTWKMFIINIFLTETENPIGHYIPVKENFHCIFSLKHLFHHELWNLARHMNTSISKGI